MSTGWVKLHRKILEHELWNDVTTFRLFTLLVMKASHQDGFKMNGVVLNKGQYIRSYSKLCEDLAYKEGRGLKKLSKSTIMRSIKKLVMNNIITVSETELGTLFTIVKYESYQEFSNDHETEPRTEEEPIAERRRNESGTKSELYQELKNLRIKEEEEKRASVENDLTPFQQIEEKYLSRKGGLMLTPKDSVAIERILKERIPLEEILVWIDEVFDQYQPKHRADSIKSFAYLESAILDRWHAKQKPPNNVSEFKRKPQKHSNWTPKGVKKDAEYGGYLKGVGESQSTSSAEVERLEALAREKGLSGKIRDTHCDF
ncbi:hypothetical protein KZX64_10725 [Bacillus pumilus]|uniref:hypothetical protein n=1 Tax=Bacillus TaxID=1386 RepID=UPI00166FF50A|nr:MULTISPECIES: hypothetical protein [Bacillus]MCK6164058.1 hypothetical protein [Bacillus pumilus]MCK6184564.1 hypothetical protein [Bacillus pumilus]